MRVLAEINRSRVLAVLIRRLAEEREKIARYRGLVGELATAEPALRRILPRVEIQLGEERELVGWLEARLRDLGDPLAPRDPGGEGVAAPIGVVEALRALLATELADEQGWAQLEEVAILARDHGAEDALRRWRQRAATHGRYLAAVLARLLENDLLGRPVTLPLDAPAP